MNKAQFISEFSKENVITKAESEKIINVYMGAIQKTLKQGDDVKISGFGRWFVKKRKSRKVKNPQTGELIKVDSFKVPMFKAGKVFKNVFKK